MGCCLAATLLMLGPRMALILIWLLTNWYNAFDSTFVAFVAWLFLPWTSLSIIYIYCNHQGVVSGGYLALLIVGIVLDISSWGSGRLSTTK
jgi:hypothetical protein